MPETPTYKFEIQVINTDGITPDSIVRAPRVYKPQDLQSALQNLKIISSGAEPVLSVVALVDFVLLDFFVLAHRTGLYNRQKSLWESLSKIAVVSVFALKKGIFRRTAIPAYDLHFQDHRGRTVIFAHLIDPTYVEKKDVSEKLMQRFLRRAEKIGGLTGLFLCYPEPFPESVSKKVSKLTGGDDPVGRYESLLPEPWSIPLDLLELPSSESERSAPAAVKHKILTFDLLELPSPEPEGSASTAVKQKIRLVHPDLTAPKRIRAANVREEN